jgi:microcystin degradation protein MlrC
MTARRIGLIHVSQETNDFNPRPTTLTDYEAFGLYEGAEVIARAGATGQVAGHLRAVAESGLAVETVPIIRAHAVAGGRIDRASHAFFLDRIRSGLAGAGRLDGLALYLHGACAADGEDDVEGVQAALCREILGPSVPIMLGLDHHANVTRRMVASVDAIVGHRTQPHDQFDTGLIGTRLLLRILSEGLRPRMAMRKIPLVTHQEQFLTAHGPMKTWFDRARAMEADPRVLQAVPFPMQPWLDVDEGGWTAVVVTNDDQALSERLADELADLAWSLRDDFLVREAVPVDEAVRMADAEPAGLVVLSDTGDTVFGGAAGDSNVILEAMLRLGVRGPALVPMIAPGVVARLFAAGEGATVTLPVGGETATAFFTPIEVSGRVRRLAHGRVAVSGYQDAEIDMGRTAVFEIGPVTLLVSELRGVAGNLPDVYRAFGIEPAEARMVVLKTASNFQYFAPISRRVIRADTRGPGQSDVFTLPWKRLPRPIYPLERMSRRDEPRTPPGVRGAA